ncbi:MAG: carboxypeptidase-like regulatory domain-containing protein, partial [Bdellovibrionota bacterium]
QERLEENAQEKKRTLAATTLHSAPSTYLSNLSLSEPASRVQVAEMKFNKSEFLAAQDTGFRTANIFMAQPEAAEVTNTLINKWATIRGKFELIDGVGVVDHYIELKRIEEGQVREAGRIDLIAGQYSIDIESPRGYLIAQIKDRNGRLIGEDRERLINLYSRGNFYEGPFLRVGLPPSVAVNPSFRLPAEGTRVASGSTNNVSKKTGDNKSPVAATIFDNQNWLEKPGDVFTNVSNYSSTISRIFDPSQIYKNITSIRHTGEKTETFMFTTKWTEGVISYISDVQKIEFKSKNGPIIIGRVLSDGKPVLHAEVQLAMTTAGAPIYFDQFMIPSVTQTSTSENGYFMFVGLEPNNYHIVAAKEGLVLGSQMFIAEEDSIAFQNIATQSIPKTNIVRSFDAFTAEPANVEVVFTDAEGALETRDGNASFKTYSQNGISEYLVKTNDQKYLPIRYIQSSLQEYVHLPMIQEQWLSAITEFKKIIRNPDDGIIVGFSKNLSYDIYLTAEGYNKENMVYFNSFGEIVSEATLGGGFILFNVPAGAREVVAQEQNTERIYSQVFNVMAGQISVTHFSAD